MKIKLRREVLVICNLAEDLDGYTIMHISDLHFKDFMNNDKALNGLILSQNSDLTLITGDFITSDNDVVPLLDFLKKIRSKDGVFATLGNHDYIYSTIPEHFIFSKIRGIKRNNVQRLIDLLSDIGIRVLINDSALIHRKNSIIFLEGTDDPVLGKPAISEKDPNYDKSDFKILLTHSPDMLYLSDFNKKYFDLVLSGHTHGGQIRIPFFGPIVTSTKFVQKNEVLGLFRKNNTNVNVSGGIGHSALPIRINCPSEIVLITLKKN